MKKSLLNLTVLSCFIMIIFNKDLSANSDVRILTGFEENREAVEFKRSPFRKFSLKSATQGKRSAVILLESYNNFTMTTKVMSDWSGYDFLCMDVFNPSSELIDFALAIKDNLSTDYWTQYNEYTRLSPGWNKLSFRLKRFVGERGSSRVKRYLNLSKLKSFWFRVSKSKKGKPSKSNFLVDNIILKKGKQIEFFKGLMAFDFVDKADKKTFGFTPVSKETYFDFSAKSKFGFTKNTSFWRTHNSVYADVLHKDAIIATKGRFRVKLPNGRYKIQLVINMLGYWDVPFWSRRRVHMQGFPVLNQVRLKASDYQKELLRFENIVPKITDNAYDLYLKPIFKPIEKEVNIVNGLLDIEFEGDETGIAFNSLLIWPVKKQKEANKFLKSLHDYLRADFENDVKLIVPKVPENLDVITKKDKTQGVFVTTVSSMKRIRHSSLFKGQGKTIKLRGGYGEYPFQSILLRNLKKRSRVKVTVSDLTSGSGKKITQKQMIIRYGVPQYVSHSLNHETYELIPRFFQNLPKKGLLIEKNYSHHLFFQVPITPNLSPGTYRGKLTINVGAKKEILPVFLEVYPFTLPKVDLPVGFFGLTPVKVGWFKAKKNDRNTFEFKWQKKALKVLADRGFTTWTGLPDVELKEVDGQMEIEATFISKLFEYARKLGFNQEVFSYGSFPFGNLLEKGTGFSQVLKRKINNSKWLPIIYTFSDEAEGYSDLLDEKLKEGKILKAKYPFLRRGGFSHMLPYKEKNSKLNHYFNDGSYSSFSKKEVKSLEKKGLRWGSYNAASRAFDNPRFSFGEGLFVARKNGLSHRLEWHFALHQNYHYYDLDGREGDAFMVFPKQNGDLETSLKFEWATQGLEDYRLLTLLEKLVKNNPKKSSKAKKWLEKYYYNQDFFEDSNYLDKRTSNHSSFEKFRDEIYSHILSLLPKATL